MEAVFIDNVRPACGADFYSASVQSGQFVWSVTGLPRGSHTFKLQVSGATLEYCCAIGQEQGRSSSLRCMPAATGEKG